MTPLSLEEIIDAKKAKEEELSKPKFLTKAERAQLALERRQKEAEEKRRQMDELRNVFFKSIFLQRKIKLDQIFQLQNFISGLKMNCSFK